MIRLLNARRGLGLFGLAVMLLVGCNPAADPTAPPASATPTPAPPQLLAPQDDDLDRLLSPLALEWAWERELAEDEYFDVRVWREGEPHYGIGWSKAQRYDMGSWLASQPAGTYQWSVAVIEGHDGEVVREITDEAPPASFTLHDDYGPVIADHVTAPPGFDIAVMARLPDSPTTITTGPDGQLYVLTLQGNIYRLNQPTPDSKPELEAIFESAAAGLEYTSAVGLAFLDEVAYVSDAGRITTLRDSDGDGFLDEQTVIVEGLPAWQYWGHSNNSLVFGPDGKLYVPVGATTDHGPLNPDEPLEAAILRMNPDGSELEVFARGFRNPYDLTFSPDGHLFTADNNPDRFDEALTFLPAEELNHVQEGRHYGFPDVFFPMPHPDGIEPPIVSFKASVGSAGLVYYSADHFPADYQDGLFVAQWGSQDVTASLRHGHQVVFVQLEPTEDGSFMGTVQPFLTFNPDTGIARPVDVTVGPDGTLWVLEFQGHFVFRVTYTGDIPAEDAPSPLEIGQRIYQDGVPGAPSCQSCHLASGDGLGPALNGIATYGGQRVSGLSAPEYVRQSIIDPDAYIPAGYTPGVMYTGYGEALTPEQLDALVEYVLSLE